MHWLYSAAADSVFILAPAFLVSLAVVLFPSAFASQQTPPYLWLLLVVGIDVAHVWSTLYRTYLDPEESKRYRQLLIWIPILCWLAGVALYSTGSLTFWRVLAYLAVFHFVRQQYGFLRLYSRSEPIHTPRRWVDGAAIYLAALYPLLYWHTHPRAFRWFIAGDFFRLDALLWLERTGFYLYLATILGYVWTNRRNTNWPKHFILTGTAVSWYTGIVLYNGDLAFTLTNVVAHGVPYMALVWIYERRKDSSPWFRVRFLPAYVGVLVLLAYFEEGLWDVLVWRDHTQFYQWLTIFPQIEGHTGLALVVPLLAVPQATHYMLDGFIWSVRSLGRLSTG